MADLQEALAARVSAWREAGYPHDRFGAIGEIVVALPVSPDA